MHQDSFPHVQSSHAGTAAPWSRVRLSTIHLGAGGAVLLCHRTPRQPRRHVLLPPGSTPLPPPSPSPLLAPFIGVGVLRTATLPSSAPTAGSEAGLLLHRPPLPAAWVFSVANSHLGAGGSAPLSPPRRHGRLLTTCTPLLATVRAGLVRNVQPLFLTLPLPVAPWTCFWVARS